jgi:hypothetical protein
MAQPNRSTRGWRASRRSGDAGELLDERARGEYRRRVDGLRAELEEADGFNDAGRAERLRAELEFVKDELARSVGLGGRVRRAASAEERARVAVQRRLRDAISRIEAVAPAIGRHLSQTVETGLFCACRPGRRLGATKARGTRW